MSLLARASVAVAGRRVRPQRSALAFARSCVSERRSVSGLSRALQEFKFSPAQELCTTNQQPKSFFGVDARLFSSAATDEDPFFAKELSFSDIGVESPVLRGRLQKMGFDRPTLVQAATYNAIKSGEGDVTIGAETGSGKTLAYLLPLLDEILQRKMEESHNRGNDDWSRLSYDYARALILVPNKELVQQVLRMAVPLCGGAQKAVVWSAGYAMPPETAGDGGHVDPASIVRLAVVPGGLEEPLDFKPFRDSIGLGGTDPPVDLLVTTPAALGPLGLKPKHIDVFGDIQTVIIDEADMLLDGGYIRPLENVLMGFKRADRVANREQFNTPGEVETEEEEDDWSGAKKTQHVFVAATLPDMGLRSVDAYLQRKFPYAERIHMAGMHNARHYGLAQPTVWIQEEYKKERMEQLVDMLQKPTDQGGLKGEKVMVFLNSVADVEGASGALERAGVKSAPYHAKIKLDERSKNLDRFRRYSSEHAESDDDTVPVLVCTDLASRGLDVPGVNAVIQLQFAGNVVAHLHRMGRCGRAGRRTGRGIVFYKEQEQELVDVVRAAESQQERMVLEGDVDDRDDEEVVQAGTVKEAFSRKRGFTKKRKKIRREAA